MIVFTCKRRSWRWRPALCQTSEHQRCKCRGSFFWDTLFRCRPREEFLLENAWKFFGQLLFFRGFLDKDLVTSCHEEGECRQLSTSLPLVPRQKVVEELPIVLADVCIEASENLVDGSSNSNLLAWVYILPIAQEKIIKISLSLGGTRNFWGKIPFLLDILPILGWFWWHFEI